MLCYQYDWEKPREEPTLEELRRDYESFGLYILESFEEYARDRLESEH